jgi:single-strand DNA-binding protein
MVNKVFLIGNLGRDPEVRHIDGGSVVANFSLATNENYKDKSGEWQKITEWHDVVAWGNLAEYAEKWLKKGSLIFVEGKLTHRKYQDKEGVERYKTEVKAVSIRMMEKMGAENMAADTSSPSRQSDIPIVEDAGDDLPF